MSSLYIGLVHYPVLNRNNEIIQTAVTNLDIHDIARSARTFGVKQYHMITPEKSQQDYIRQVIHFWQSESGQTYNSDRSRALDIITISDSIESCIMQITTQEGKRPIVISTTARNMHHQIAITELGNLQNNDNPMLILFGTGYGLTDAIHQSADCILKPLKGTGKYNHLSVRSAVAIVLDRLTSAVYKGRN
jgi:hypothetical protein